MAQRAVAVPSARRRLVSKKPMLPARFPKPPRHIKRPCGDQTMLLYDPVPAQFRGSGFGVWGLGFGVSVQCLGSRVWGLGFGVWGLLGFRVVPKLGH